MEDDINMDLEETGWEREDWIHLAEGQRQVAGSCKQVGVLLIFRRHFKSQTSYVFDFETVPL